MEALDAGGVVSAWRKQKGDLIGTILADHAGHEGVGRHDVGSVGSVISRKERESSESNAKAAVVQDRERCKGEGAVESKAMLC